MSSTVENRVLIFNFDNSNFEHNVAQSMGTLEKLKSALHFDGSDAFKGFDRAIKGLSFDGISSSVDFLEKRFSTLGIVGMRVIENMTDSAMRFATRGVRFLTNGIVQGGIKRAMDIENAHFQLQGLLHDEAKVQAVMNAAKDSVDGTAYAYNDAAKAAASFASTGLQTGGQMEQALRALAGTAATTNSDYSSLADIFTTVAGNGRLMGMQLNQLSFRGMNAAATLRDFFNGVTSGSIKTSDSVTAAVKKLTKGLQVTEGDIREFVHDGELSFDIFAAAMDNAFGEHAKEANKTFTGALSNIKAALARLGEMFVAPLIVQEGPLVNLFNTIREKINEVKANSVDLAAIFVRNVTKMAEGATKLISKINFERVFEGIYNVVYTIRNIAQGIGSVLKPIGQAFLNIFPPKSALDTFISVSFELRKLTSHLKLSDSAAKNLRDTFSGLFSIFKTIGHIIAQVVSAFVPLSYASESVFGVIVEGVLAATGALGRFLTYIGNLISSSTIIHDILFPIASALSSIVKTLISAGKSVFSTVKSWVQEFMQLPIVVEILGKLKDALHDVGDFIKDGVQNIAEQLKNLNNVSLSDITAKLKNLGNSIRNALFNKGFFKKGFLSFSGIKEGLQEFINEGINAPLKGSGKTIKDFTSMFTQHFGKIGKAINENIGLGEIFTMVWGGMFAVSMHKTGKIIDSFLSILKGMRHPIEGLGQIFKGIGTVITEMASSLKRLSKAMAFDFYANGILKMGIAIGIIAGSIYALARIKDKGDLRDAVIVIGGIMAALTIMSKFAQGSTFSWTLSEGIKASVNSLLSMAVAIGIIAASMKLISTMDWPSIGKGLAVIGAMMAGMWAFSKAMSKIPTDMPAKIGLSFIGMAIAVGLMAGALREISRIDFSNPVAIIGGLAAIIGSLSALSWATKFMEKSGWKSGFGMAGIAASVYIMAKAIKAITEIDMSSVESNIKAFGLVFGSLIGMLIAANLAGEYAARAGAGIFLMSTSLIAIAAAIKMLSGMEAADITRAMDTISDIFLLFGILTAVSSLSGGSAHKAGAMILLMAGALMLLVPTIGALATIGRENPEGLRRGVEALAVVFSAFGLVTALSGFTEKAKVAPMVAMCVALGELIGALGGLAMIKADRLQAATKSLAIVMGMFALIEGMSFFTGYARIGPMVGMIAVIAGLVGALSIMDSLNVDSAIQNATSLSILLGVMTGCLTTLSLLTLKSGFTAKGSMAAVGALAVLGLVVGELVGIFAIMKHFDINVSLDAAAGLSLLLATMTGVMVVLTAIGAGGFGSMVAVVGGIVALGTTVAGLAAVIATLGHVFDKFEGLESKVDRGIIILQKLGKGLGGFFGGLVGGFLDGLDLPTLGTIAESLKGFVNTFADIPSESFDNIGKLSTSLLKLEGVRLADLLMSAFGGDVSTDLSKYMGALGEGLGNFSQGLNTFNYDPDKVDDAVECMTKLSTMIEGMGTSGGLFGWIKGSSYDSFKAMTLMMPFLADGLSAMSEAFSDENFDLSSIDAVVPTLEKLNGFIQQMDASGGVKQFFTGSKMNSLEFLITDLPRLATALSEYSNNIAGFDANLVKDSVPAMSGLIKALGGLWTSGGLKQLIAGSKTGGLEGLVDNLGQLGFGFRMYMMAINGISDFSNASASAEALGSLVKAVSGIFSAGGAMAKLKGDQAGGLAALSGNLGRLGMGLRMYMMGINGISDFSNVGPSVTALTQLMDFMNKASNFNVSEFMSGSGLVQGQNFRGLDKSGSSMEGFAKNLERLGEAMGNYSTSMQGADFDPSQLMSAISALNEFANLSAKLQLYSDKTGDNMFQGLADSLPVIGTALKDLATAVPDVEAFMSTADALTTMRTAFEGLSGIDVSGIEGIKSSLDGLAHMSFDTFSTSLANMATTMSQTMTSMAINVSLGAVGVITALNNMSSQMQAAVTKGATSVALHMTAMMARISSAVAVGGSAVASAMTAAMARMAAAAQAGSTAVVSAVARMMTSAVSTISGFQGMFTAAGLALAVALSNGFKGGGTLIALAARAAAQAGANAARTASASFYAAGVACGQGLARGLLSQAASVRAAGAQLGAAGAQGARSQLNINSPSKVFMSIGASCAEGLSMGIRNNVGEASNASAGMANGVINSFCDVMKINSPSLKMNELGHYVVEGLAEGITSDMSAEDAMAKKAENIVNAFKTKLDEIDLDITTLDLLKEIWDLENRNAEEKIMNEKTVEYLQDKIKLQSEALKLAEDEWEESKRNLEDAEKIQQAENKMHQEKIELLKLEKELEETLAEIRNNNFKSEREQKAVFDTWNKKYLEELKAARELVELGWITEEQADKMAKESAERYTGVLFENLFPGQEDVKWRGGQITEAYAEGMSEKKEEVADAANDISEFAVVAVGNMENDMFKAGENLGSALAAGIRSKLGNVANAATGLAKAVTGTTKDELEINSPSRVFTRIGEYLSEGLAIGITNASGLVINSLSGLSGRIGRAIESDSNFSPSITPVIDTSRITADSMSMNPIFASQFTIPNNEWNYKMYEAQKDFISSNERVVSAVRDLRDDLNTIYQDNNGEVSLYVDSKKLASTIAKPMNRQLSVLSRRGAY